MVKPGDVKNSKPSARWRSAFLVAALAFFFLNGLLSFANPVNVDPFEYPIHTWSWWSVQALRQRETVSNLAFMGSSLIVTAISESDARFLGRRLDLTTHREARYFDDQLSKRLNGEIKSINLSAPGQMPSDALLMLKAALMLGHKPDFIVYGLAPRDFIDGTLSDPTDTEAFKILERIVDESTHRQDLAVTPWARLFHGLRDRIYLLSRSIDLQMQLDDLAVKLFSRSALAVDGAEGWSQKNRMAILPTYKMLELSPGLVYANPRPKEATAKSGIEESGDEPPDLPTYRTRYRNPDMTSYAKQLSYLKMLVDTCKKEGICIVLVNMPVRECNLALLTPGMHKRYLNDIESLSASESIPYFDMCETTAYSKSDYHDSVHLNSLGGEKFVKRLVSNFARSAEAQARLKEICAANRRTSVAGLAREPH